MRRGEFLALRWSDVDFTFNIASIQRSVEQTNDGIRFKSPKGARVDRSALLPITIEALGEHRQLQDEQKKRLGAVYRDEDLICAR